MSGLSRSRLESDISHEIRRLSRNLKDQDASAIASAVAEAISRNNTEIEQDIEERIILLKQELLAE